MKVKRTLIIFLITLFCMLPFAVAGCAEKEIGGFGEIYGVSAYFCERDSIYIMKHDHSDGFDFCLEDGKAYVLAVGIMYRGSAQPIVEHLTFDLDYDSEIFDIVQTSTGPGITAYYAVATKKPAAETYITASDGKYDETLKIHIANP